MCIARKPSTVVTSKGEVPTIDLDNLDVNTFRDACETYGTVYVTSAEVRKVLQQGRTLTGASRAFFNLDLATKNKYSKGPVTPRGYSPHIHLAKRGEKPRLASQRESWSVGAAAKQVNTNRAYSNFTAPNISPSEEDAPGFQVALHEYYSAMQRLQEDITAALEAAMHVERGLLQQKMNAKFITMLVSHYLSQQSRPEADQLALGAHKDASLFTLLFTEAKDGLEIFLDNDWHPVPSRQDCLLLNLGLQAERLTNGAFTGILHRVNNRTGCERYSVATFFGVDPHATVEPLPGFVSDDRPQTLPSCLGAEQHVNFFKGIVAESMWHLFQNSWDALISDAHDAAAAAARAEDAHAREL